MIGGRIRPVWISEMAAGVNIIPVEEEGCDLLGFDFGQRLDRLARQERSHINKKNKSAEPPLMLTWSIGGGINYAAFVLIWSLK